MKLRFAVLAVLCSLAAATQAASIRWEALALPKGAPAELTAQVGRMTVPQRRDHPDGGTLDVAFVRLQRNGGSKSAPIVYLPGGPGGAGSGVARSPEALASFAQLAQAGDVILFDPRGTGMSSPRAVCRPPVPLTPEERFGDTARMGELFARGTRTCLEEWSARGLDPAAFTNAESAADLDDLRKGLGVPQISLLGFSYGTHLALATIRAHGAGIARAVLLGTEGPNHTRKLPLTIDTQLGKLAILSGQDLPSLLRTALAKLEREPMVVTVHDRAQKKDVRVSIGPDAFRRLLIQDIGDGNDFPVFPALLQTVSRGETGILRWFVEKRYNQGGVIDLMVIGMECSSGATPDRERQIQNEAQRSLFRNAMNFPFPEVCAAFPGVDLGDTFRGPLLSPVPVLFISGTLDSNTPPFQAEELRWGMPNASHLIVENAGHEDTLPMPGVQAAIRDYLAGQDVSGRVLSLPRPHFLTIEEALANRR